jgi:hypothetical protein
MNSFDWIVNQSLSTTGAEYHHRLRACIINYEESWPGRDMQFSIGFHASILVHEATHARLEQRGLDYGESNRVRIEALCVREQNRWAARLKDRVLGERLHQDFDPGDWESGWNMSWLQQVKATVSNILKDRAE